MDQLNSSEWYRASEPKSTTTAQKIDSFASLPVGWHYGEGKPIDKLTLKRTRAVYQDLITLGFTQTDAFPGFDGEVRLTAYALPNYLEIDIHLDGSYSYILERAGQEISSGSALDYQDLKSALREIRGAQWTTFGLYTRDITTRNLSGSRVSLFASLGADYRLSMPSASSRWEMGFAGT